MDFFPPATYLKVIITNPLQLNINKKKSIFQKIKNTPEESGIASPSRKAPPCLQGPRGGCPSSLLRHYSVEVLFFPFLLTQICRRKGKSVLTGFSDNYVSLFDCAPKHKSSGFL